MLGFCLAFEELQALEYTKDWTLSREKSLKQKTGQLNKPVTGLQTNKTLGGITGRGFQPI